MSTATILVVAAVFIAGLALGALIISLVLRRRNVPLSKETNLSKPALPDNKLSSTQVGPLVFRWNFVVAPLVLAIACLLTTLAFIFYLPSQLAFRFNPDGSVLNTMNKYIFAMLIVASQSLCALAALSIARAIVRLGKRMYKAGEPQMNLSGFVSLMSNMVLLPQVILAYLMLDAFIYGVWSRHLISTRTFAITAIVIGSAILPVLFTRLASRARGALNKQ